MEHEQKLREKKKKNAEDDLEYMVKTSPDVACAFETRFVGNAILLEQARDLHSHLFYSHLHSHLRYPDLLEQMRAVKEMRHHGELTAMDEAAMIAGIEQQRRNLHNQGTTHIAKVDDKDALVSVAAFRFLTIVKDEHLEHVEQGALQGVASKRKKSKRQGVASKREQDLADGEQTLKLDVTALGETSVMPGPMSQRSRRNRDSTQTRDSTAPPTSVCAPPAPLTPPAPTLSLPQSPEPSIASVQPRCRAAPTADPSQLTTHRSPSRRASPNSSRRGGARSAGPSPTSPPSAAFR